MAKIFWAFLVILLLNLINLRALLWKPISFSSGLWSKLQSRIWQVLMQALVSSYLDYYDSLCTTGPKVNNLAKESGPTSLLCWPPFSCSHLKSWFRVLFICKALNGSAHNHNLLCHCSITRSLWRSDLGHLAFAVPRLQNNIHHSCCGCWALQIPQSLSVSPWSGETFQGCKYTAPWITDMNFFHMPD